MSISDSLQNGQIVTSGDKFGLGRSGETALTQLLKSKELLEFIQPQLRLRFTAIPQPQTPQAQHEPSLKAEQFGLWTRIATESVSLCGPMK